MTACHIFSVHGKHPPPGYKSREQSPNSTTFESAQHGSRLYVQQSNPLFVRLLILKILGDHAGIANCPRSSDELLDCLCSLSFKRPLVAEATMDHAQETPGLFHKTITPLHVPDLSKSLPFSNPDRQTCLPHFPLLPGPSNGRPGPFRLHLHSYCASVKFFVLPEPSKACET